MVTPVFKGEPKRIAMSGSPVPMWNGYAGAPPILFYNKDTANAIYLGYTNNISIGGINTVELDPQSSTTMDGSRTIYAIGPNGAGPLQVIPGGTNFFSALSSFTVGIPPNTQIQLLSQDGTGFFNFLLNNALFGNAQMFSQIIGGAAQLVLNGPKLLNDDDFYGEIWESNDGASTASWTLVYNDASGVPHTVAEATYAGLDILAGVVNGVQPGTGISPVNAAVTETWHPLALINGWAGSGGGVNGIFYKLLATGDVHIVGDILNSLAVGNSVCAVWPAGYAPGSVFNFPASWNNPVANNSASAPWVNANPANLEVVAIEAANYPIFFEFMMPLAAV